MLPLALLVLPLKGLGHVNRAVLARTVSNLAGESKPLPSLTPDLGFTVTGACPNDPADVLCCIKTSCKSGTGTCLDTNVVGCPGGQFDPGYCPGPTNVQCCVKDVGTTCKNNNGQSGICQDKSTTSCPGGQYEAGFCPGPTNIQCCIKSCPEYWVVGVRGSNEHDGSIANNDINQMGDTLAQYIGVAANILPSSTEYFGLPYPAELSNLEEYLSSEEQGWQSLVPIIKSQVQVCPNIKIGVAGYSQGANVVNDALHFLESDDPGSLDHIKAVLLLADPKNDPNQSYDLLITLDGVPAPKTTNTGVLGAQVLPDQVKGVATSLCIENDIVCDSASNIPGLIIQGMEAAIHSSYKACCTDFDFPAIAGASFANRMTA